MTADDEAAVVTEAEADLDEMAAAVDSAAAIEIVDHDEMVAATEDHDESRLDLHVTVE